MISPIEKYKSLAAIEGIKDIAYDTLFTKYLIQDRRGAEKLDEIDSTDQESLMVAFNGGRPLPGFMYTFIYPTKLDPGKYTDYAPIVFCIKIEKEGFRGINLNVLPWQERVKFLQEFYSVYSHFTIPSPWYSPRASFS